MKRLNGRQLSVGLAALWLVVQLVVLMAYGVRTGVDTDLYVTQARELLNGNWPDDRGAWYVGYSVFLALIFLLKGNLFSVAIIQILLSGLAAHCLFKLTVHFTQTSATGYLSVFLYIAWIKIHQWNIFIYTESLFTSLSLIALALLVSSNKWRLAGVALLLLCVFIRPTGFCLVGALGAWGLFALYQRHRFAAVALGTTGLILLVVLFNQLMRSTDLMGSYASAEVIYPGIQLGVQPLLRFDSGDYTDEPIINMVRFVWHYPFHFAQLVVVKLVLFISNMKPYYSTLHLIAIGVFLFPLYFFAVRGYRSHVGYEKSFVLAYFVIQAVVVSLTSENWDGRFLVPLLPLVFVLSAVGISKTAAFSNWQTV